MYMLVKMTYNVSIISINIKLALPNQIVHKFQLRHVLIKPKTYLSKNLVLFKEA